MNALLALVSVIALLPALKLLAPVTDSAPVWLSAPLLLTASVPAVPAPSAVAWLLLRLTLPPVRLTAPVNALLALLSVIALLPALKLLAPVTVKAPPWVMAPAVVCTDRPPLPMVSAPALKLPLLVARRLSAALPPTAPRKSTRPFALTVRSWAPSSVPANVTVLPLASVAFAPSVTASL